MRDQSAGQATLALQLWWGYSMNLRTGATMLAVLLLAAYGLLTIDSDVLQILAVASLVLYVLLIACAVMPKTVMVKWRGEQALRGKELWQVLLLGYPAWFALLLAGAGLLHLPRLIPPTNLHEAARRGDEAAAERLLAKGHPVDDRGKGGETPLYMAAQEGQVGLAKLLIKHGADIDATNRLHRTPLNAAALNGHLETVRFLLAHGAAVEGVPPAPTPLYSALQHCHMDVANLLMAEGASSYGREWNGERPRDLLARCAARTSP